MQAVSCLAGNVPGSSYATPISQWYPKDAVCGSRGPRRARMPIGELLLFTVHTCTFHRHNRHPRQPFACSISVYDIVRLLRSEWPPRSGRYPDHSLYKSHIPWCVHICKLKAGMDVCLVWCFAACVLYWPYTRQHQTRCL